MGYHKEKMKIIFCQCFTSSNTIGSGMFLKLLPWFLCAKEAAHVGLMNLSFGLQNICASFVSSRNAQVVN
jgi:hypothetical protein